MIMQAFFRKQRWTQVLKTCAPVTQHRASETLWLGISVSAIRSHGVDVTSASLDNKGVSGAIGTAAEVVWKQTCVMFMIKCLGFRASVWYTVGWATVLFSRSTAC